MLVLCGDISDKPKCQDHDKLLYDVYKYLSYLPRQSDPVITAPKSHKEISKKFYYNPNIKKNLWKKQQFLNEIHRHKAIKQ